MSRTEKSSEKAPAPSAFQGVVYDASRLIPKLACANDVGSAFAFGDDALERIHRRELRAMRLWKRHEGKNVLASTIEVYSKLRALRSKSIREDVPLLAGCGSRVSGEDGIDQLEDP